MEDHTLYTLWLLLAGKIGSRRNGLLLQAMTPQQAYRADEETLLRHLSEKDAEFFLDKDLTPAIKLAEECKEKGIRPVCFHDAEYPPALREISDPPAVLFCLGKLPKANFPTMGIVGTRKCSRTAAGLAATFSASLALSGFQIVSGMANGVDTYAHKGPLIKGIPSFAVLGCGVDIVYPKQNQNLYDILKKHGGLISEYPPSTPPLASNFPRRNRIISGISDGILVVECPKRSGSMSTARYALEQNRMLFAIPSAPDDRINTGTNELIRNGAVFCTEPEDIFKEFQPRFSQQIKPTVVRFLPTEKAAQSPPAEEEKKPKKPRKKQIKQEQQKNPSPAKLPSLSPEEETVYRAFSEGETLSADEIILRTGIPFQSLLPLLQGLELIGAIESVSGSQFRRI